MANDYSIHFKKNFEVLINSVDFSDYHYKSTDRQNNLVLSYFGSLHSGRDKMLFKFANIIFSKNTNIVINLYSTDSLSNFTIKKFQSVGINFMGQLYNDDLKNAILESDILLHIESDIATNVNKTFYSISTKIPEYLLSKKPILAFGPLNIASFKLLSNNNIGYVIPSNINIDLIKEKFSKFINDENLRLKITTNGFNYAKEFFNNKTMTDKLHKAINFRYNNYNK